MIHSFYHNISTTPTQSPSFIVFPMSYTCRYVKCWLLLVWAILMPCTAVLAQPKDNPAVKGTGHKEIEAILDSATALAHQNPDAALLLFKKALDLSINGGYGLEATDAFSHIITIYNNKGQYDEALAETRRVEALVVDGKVPDLLPAVYNSLANRYQRKGLYDSAMRYYYAAIAAVEKGKTFNEASLPTLYTNLSGVLEIMGDDVKSLQYLQKAEHIARDIKHSHLLALILINKGNIFNNLRQQDSSIHNLKEALAIARAKHFLQWQHLALSNLGSVYYYGNQPREALTYLEEAVKLKGDVDPNYQNTNISLLGKVYLSLGDYRRAEEYLRLSLEKAQQLNIARGVLEGHSTLSRLYAQQGNFKAAYRHQASFVQLKDSIEGKETKQNINQLEVKYRTAQKDKELVQKELQISRQKSLLKQRNLWIMGISAGALLLAAIAALLYSLYRSNWHQKRFQEQKFRSLEQEQEIGQLRAMMRGEEKERIRIAQDLHDGIGGMLASIKMNLNAIGDEQPELCTLPGFAKVSGMLADTAREVRKTAHNLMPDALSRQSLREALLWYCENNSSSLLQVDLRYDVSEPGSKAGELFLYRIVQELVQNIVKHAHASYAVVQLMLYDGRLSITVEDNGNGFDSELPVTGSGLANLKKRVEMLQGYIAISSRKNSGTTTHIEFDFVKLKNL
jgi:signal transduction histidine kinase